MDLNPAPTETDLSEPPARMPRKDRQTWWATLFLLCGILGAMLGLSVRTQQAVRHKIDNTVSSITKDEVDGLQRTVKAQQARIASLDQAISSGRGDKAELLKDMKSAKFLAGLTAVRGPGVVVTLNDSKNPYPGGLPLTQ